MVEGGGGSGFPDEATTPALVGQSLRGQDLDRHLAAEAQVAGAIDLAHSSRTERGDHLVRPEPSALEERHTNLPE
jgi:hypothetical protein